MADTLTLEIVTPAAIVYSQDVEMVTLPAVEEQLGIFPHHVPLLTRVTPGELIVRRNGVEEFLAVGGGLVEITGTSVSIVTDMAGGPWFDVSRATRSISLLAAPAAHHAELLALARG